MIEELIGLAKDMTSVNKHDEGLKLTDDELASCDALGTHDSGVSVLGDKEVAKDTVRAKLRTLVRRQLRKHGYPPDKTETAVEPVLKQAELFAAERAV